MLRTEPRVHTALSSEGAVCHEAGAASLAQQPPASHGPCQAALQPEAVRWIHWRSRSASVVGRAAVSRSTMYRGKGKLSR